MRGVGCSLEPSEGSGPMLDVELLAGGTMSQDITVVFGTRFSALCFGSLSEHSLRGMNYYCFPLKMGKMG